LEVHCNANPKIEFHQLQPKAELKDIYSAEIYPTTYLKRPVSLPSAPAL
jgi:hypothetical protein